MIALDASQSRLEYARMFGADAVLNVSELSEDEVVSRIKDLTEGIGADLVIEATGVPNADPRRG